MQRPWTWRGPNGMLLGGGCGGTIMLQPWAILSQTLPLEGISGNVSKSGSGRNNRNDRSSINVTKRGRRRRKHYYQEEGYQKMIMGIIWKDISSQFEWWSFKSTCTLIISLISDDFDDHMQVTCALVVRTILIQSAWGSKPRDSSMPFSLSVSMGVQDQHQNWFLGRNVKTSVEVFASTTHDTSGHAFLPASKSRFFYTQNISIHYLGSGDA